MRAGRTSRMRAAPWSYVIKYEKSGLEVDPNPELHVTRSICLSRDLTERCWTSKAQTGVRRLKVIERVGDGDEYLDTGAAFVEADILTTERSTFQVGKPRRLSLPPQLVSYP